MDRKAFFAAGIILLTIGLVIAVSEYEAEDYYRSAQTYLSSNDYENAIRSVYRSREAYAQLGITNGVDKCNQMISQINGTLTRNQIAGIYYNIAGDYYLLGGETIENLQRVLLMANNSKNIYTAMGDSNGVLKTDSLIQSAKTEIASITASRLEEANRLYQLAQERFIAQDYIAARAYALNASQLYAAIPDPTGMSKTATLITSTEDKIRGIRINAAASYDKALQLFARDQWDESLTYALASKRLYDSIQDADGVAKTTALISNINKQKIINIDAKLREARSYYLEAQYFYVAQDCYNSSRKAGDARAIYQELRDQALEKEKNLNEYQRVETKKYEALLKEVDTLRARIVDMCGNMTILGEAEKFYQQSQQYYLNNKLVDAISYARNARNIFGDLKNYVGMSKCDSLIEQINAKVSQIQQADIYLNASREYYAAADFDNANYQAVQAKAIYDNMMYPEKSGEVQVYIDKITNASKIKVSANNYVNTARTALENGNYAGAGDSARKARQLYAQLNYTLGIMESDKLIKESDSKLSDEQGKFQTTMIAGALAVIIIAIAAYSWMSKQRKFETEFKEKKQIEEQRIRKKEVELTLRKDEEVKEKVEDELRRLIEREREGEQ